MRRAKLVVRSFLTLLLLNLSTGETQAQDQSEFSKAQLIGKGNPAISGNSYTTTMHREAAFALKRMQTDALKDGIQIQVVSAYRSFERQKEIFEGKYNQYLKQGLSPQAAIEKIIRYSTIPGTSRHHWGTDLDLIDGGVKQPATILDPDNYEGQGVYCQLKEWLVKNAHRYGFYEVYTRDPGRKGFEYEPWHYSYAPVAIPMLKAYLKLDLKAILAEETIAGYTYFDEPFIERYRKDYLLDINPLLKQ
jgi:LAS superfamily LD-carboxypeptidase LdcB